MILEILVGTKLVLLATDHEKLSMLFNAIKLCLDQETKAVLDYMLFWAKFVPLSCYRSQDKAQMQAQMAKTIKHVCIQAKYSMTLAHMVTKADENWDKLKTRYIKNYGVKYN